MNFIELYKETKRQHDIFAEKIDSIMGEYWSICLHSHYKNPVFSVYRDDMEMDLQLEFINNNTVVKKNVGVDTDTLLKITKALREAIDEVGYCNE